MTCIGEVFVRSNSGKWAVIDWQMRYEGQPDRVLRAGWLIMRARKAILPWKRRKTIWDRIWGYGPAEFIDLAREVLAPPSNATARVRPTPSPPAA